MRMKTQHHSCIHTLKSLKQTANAVKKPHWTECEADTNVWEQPQLFSWQTLSSYLVHFPANHGPLPQTQPLILRKAINNMARDWDNLFSLLRPTLRRGADGWSYTELQACVEYYYWNFTPWLVGFRRGAERCSIWIGWTLEYSSKKLLRWIQCVIPVVAYLIDHIWQ